MEVSKNANEYYKQANSKLKPWSMSDYGIY
jgi:hypothetical protein